MLPQIKKQTKNYLVLSDPYDYERGIRSVKKPLYEQTLRKYLEQLGFKITNNTKTPSHVSWNLRLNPRASLNYKADVIVANKKGIWTLSGNLKDNKEALKMMKNIVKEMETVYENKSN